MSDFWFWTLAQGNENAKNRLKNRKYWGVLNGFFMCITAYKKPIFLPINDIFSVFQSKKNDFFKNTSPISGVDNSVFHALFFQI